jgi:hypothetical protein
VSAPVETLVSVTRFRLRALRFLPFLALHTNRTIAQIRRADGFVPGAVWRDADFAFWTMTVWRDENSMRAYGASGAHRKAAPHLVAWGDQASVCHWKQRASICPNGRKPSVACARRGGPCGSSIPVRVMPGRGFLNRR